MARRILVSGFNVIKLAELASRSDNDPGKTMHLEITFRELGYILFGMHFVYCLFPEAKDDLQELCKKINEVGGAQEFFNPIESND